MGKIVFGEGGVFHRPGHPRMFPPGLWAAAHYLGAVDQVNAQVREELFEEVLDKRHFPSYFPKWQGLRLTREEVGLSGVAGRDPSVTRREFERALPLLHAFQGWLNRYYLWSPYVLNLLYRVLQLRDKIQRDLDYHRSTINELESDPETLTEEETSGLAELRLRESILAKELNGWGWWVDFFTSQVEIPQLEAWNKTRTADDDAHHQLFERMDLLRVDLTWEPEVATPPFHMSVRGWRREDESWAAAKKRFRDAFEESLEDYRKACLEPPKAGPIYIGKDKKRSIRWGKPYPWERNPTKRIPSQPTDDHFFWLALRQVEGIRPEKIASDYRVKPVTVREGIRRTADLLQLERRPDPGGRPSVLDDP